MQDSPDSHEILRAVRSGDPQAVDALLERHRDRLRRMVRLRLNRRLWGRVDPSDIVQDALLQAAKNLDGYAQEPKISVFLWLRTLTEQQLLATHRRHLGTLKRDARLEIQSPAPGIEASSVSMAQFLIGGDRTPSEEAARAEQCRLLEEAIELLEPIDREVLALRYFEQLSNSETAQLLSIGETAASQRFLRALARLTSKMRELGIVADA